MSKSKYPKERVISFSGYRKMNVISDSLKLRINELNHLKIVAVTGSGAYIKIKEEIDVVEKMLARTERSIKIGELEKAARSK